GGRVEKDPATGEPTGILRGSATSLAKRGSTGTRSPSKEEQLDALAELLADYNRVGITSVSDRNARDGAIDLYSALRDAERLSCRVYLYYGVGASAPLEEFKASIDK